MSDGDLGAVAGGTVHRCPRRWRRPPSGGGGPRRQPGRLQQNAVGLRGWSRRWREASGGEVGWFSGCVERGPSRQMALFTTGAPAPRASPAAVGCRTRSVPGLGRWTYPRARGAPRARQGDQSTVIVLAALLFCVSCPLSACLNYSTGSTPPVVQPHTAAARPWPAGGRFMGRWGGARQFRRSVGDDGRVWPVEDGEES